MVFRYTTPQYEGWSIFCGVVFFNSVGKTSPWFLSYYPIRSSCFIVSCEFAKKSDHKAVFFHTKGPPASLRKVPSLSVFSAAALATAFFLVLSGGLGRRISSFLARRLWPPHYFLLHRISVGGDGLDEFITRLPIDLIVRVEDHAL